MSQQLLNLLDLMTMYPTLMDNLPLPAGINPDNVVNAIILKSGRSYPLYQNPVIFKTMLNALLQGLSPTIARLYETTQYDYNPIENYDRNEEGTRNITTANTGTVKRENEGTITGNATSTNNSTTTNTVAAYDSSTYQPDSQSETTGGTTGTDSTTSNSEDNTTSQQNGTDTQQYSNRVHGNIGVTTTQQMIEQERKVALFNVYEWIAVEVDHRMFYGIYNVVR